ncbi:MAG: type II secretion system protein [Verrucomicrobiae bacterium]|nr:type II secretion system protein [Verrucomicrobiae bacterium]
MRLSRSDKCSAFTLVELLAVITIIAILAALSVPALRALQGTALQVAARQVYNDLSLTRQYAITGRTPTRFGIAVDWTTTPNSNLICRAYIILQQTNDLTTGAPLGWVPLQDWRFLPDGVVFSDHNFETDYNTINLPSSPNLGAPTTRNLGTSGSEWQRFTPASNTVVYLGATPVNWTLSVVDFRPTGYAGNVKGAAGGIRIMQGQVANPQNRTLIITDTNNWYYIECDRFGNRLRIRNRDSYRQAP